MTGRKIPEMIDDGNTVRRSKTGSGNLIDAALILNAALMVTDVSVIDELPSEQKQLNELSTNSILNRMY